MTTSPAPLTRTERAEIETSLMEIRDRLDRAGEMLAAVQISRALGCLALGSSSLK
jgi:hypothetical protein